MADEFPSFLGLGGDRHLRSLLATGLILTGGLPAFGYRMIQNTTTGTVSAGYPVLCSDPGGFAHWGSSSISWYLNTSGQGSGKDTAIQNALASWTNVSKADHTLTYVGTTEQLGGSDLLRARNLLRLQLPLRMERLRGPRHIPLLQRRVQPRLLPRASLQLGWLQRLYQ